MAEEEPSPEALIYQQIKNDVEPLEQRLGIEVGFFIKLLEEDSDWSFIIKLCALIEVAVAHYLATKLDNSKLQDRFLRLDLANTNTGQIAFLKSLDLLEADRGYIATIARIRNDYAHNISNVMLTLENYFSLKSHKGQLGMLKAALKKQSPLITDESIENSIRKAPKLNIWMMGMFLMCEIYSNLQPKSLGKLFEKI